MLPSEDSSKLEAYTQHLSNLDDYEKTKKGDGKYSEDTEKYILRRRQFLQKVILGLSKKTKS